MRMPKYEKIRNRSLRNYDRPRENKLWGILNKPFTLWVFTAIIGSALTFAYSNLQSCLKDADAKSIAFMHLKEEVFDRRLRIVDAIEQSKSIDELRLRLRTIPSTRSEFKEVALSSLTSDLIDFQVLTKPYPLAPALGAAVIEISDVNSDDTPYLQVLNGAMLENASADFFEKIKEVQSKIRRLVYADVGLQTSLRVVPYCTINDAFLSLFSSRGPIMEIRDFPNLRGSHFEPLPPSKPNPE